MGRTRRSRRGTNRRRASHACPRLPAFLAPSLRYPALPDNLPGHFPEHLGSLAATLVIRRASLPPSRSRNHACRRLVYSYVYRPEETGRSATPNSQSIMCLQRPRAIIPPSRSTRDPGPDADPESPAIGRSRTPQRRTDADSPSLSLSPHQLPPPPLPHITTPPLTLSHHQTPVSFLLHYSSSSVTSAAEK